MSPTARGPSPRLRRGIRLAVASVALALLLAAPTVVPGASAGAPSAVVGTPGILRTIAYNSTVDGFALSYLEWLPAGYLPRQATPLVVFLHGLGAGSVPVTGGLDGNTVPFSVVKNASAAHMILISLNTRTESGFYADTPCGGPQQQDVLDAIAHEKALRKVGAVYLLGFSMGTVGALEIAGHFPGLISGIGLVAPITDLFEQLAYSATVHSLPRQYPKDLCGRLPSATNTLAARITEYLSVARFAPTNFSGIPIYAVAGADDRTVPNNFTLWSFAQTNSTFVNSTCLTSTTLGEPANCTTPFWSLVKLHPALFSFRFVWEPTGRHGMVSLPVTDFFDFLAGTVPPAFLSATFPPGNLTALPPPP